MERKSNVTLFKWIVIIALAVALSLELFAKGITMKFALQGGVEYKTYSYFSHMVYGYFIVPMIAGIMTAATLLLSILSIIFKRNKRIYVAASICSIVAVIGAVISISMTVRNPVGVCVTILLVISCLCLLYVRKKISENL
jgi:hypothetical protein